MRRCVVLLLVGLAACSSGHPRTVAVPAPGPGPATVVPVSPSPSPVVLRFPATKVGAKAIAKAYFEQATLAERTGETATLRSLAAPSCQCNGVATYIEKFYPTGERHIGKGFRLTAVRIDILHAHSAAITVTYNFAPSDFVEPNGKHVPHSGVRGATAGWALDGGTGQWRIVSSLILNRGKAWPP